MTIIVGIICREGVVLASDSQAGSFRGVHVKRLDYTKIYDFGFDGAKVVVTGAGETPFIARAIELIQEKGSETKFHKPREVANIAEEVMNEINKRYVIERLKDLGSTKAPTLQQEDLIRPPELALMLGLHCGQTPCLYTIYPDGVAGKEERYASLGSGSAFAEYLLARLYRDDFTLEEAVRVAVYVVEEVKKVDLHCGGPTQVVVVKADAVERKTDNEVRSIVQYLDEQDGHIKNIWTVIAKGPEVLEQQLAKSGR